MADNHKVMKDKTGQAINETLREIRNVLMPREYGTIYGFHINSAESDPEDCVTYLEDAAGFTPAHMDYTNDKFVWGSWRDAFFMPRPCMLKYDGTVDYYLDPLNYALKYEGGASDIADASYGGNAMMEWGQNGKKIWYKIVPDASDNTSASVYIADYQVDDDFVCWSFVNNQGDLVDHFYTPIYNGTLIDGKLRSISGKAYSDLIQGKTSAQEMTAAKANNPGTDVLWTTETFADVTLINLLLILMAKSLDCQTAFGQGRCGQSSAASSMLGTGTMNDKGLFWGSSANTYGVKVFGMENWWGNQWRRYAGHIMVDYVQKFKMTYGIQDGSAQDGYLTSTTASDYAGYLTGATGPNTNNYVKEMQFLAIGCFMTKTVGGTSVDSAHYWCDYWYQNSGLRYALRGGHCAYSAGSVGPFYVNLNDAPDHTTWNVGAAPSCKPLS